MVIGLGVAGVEERHLVDVLRQLREYLRDPRSRLAMLLERERRLHQRPDLVGEEAGVLVETRSSLPSRFASSGL